MSFNDFNFKPYIREALAELKFKNPTEVQQKLIPVVRSGRDLVGESKTGSGKTHTFLLPIFEKLDETSDNVQVVITAPSRELVTQIYQATKQIADKSETEIRVANYVVGQINFVKLKTKNHLNHISSSEHLVVSMIWLNLATLKSTRHTLL